MSLIVYLLYWYQGNLIYRMKEILVVSEICAIVKRNVNFVAVTKSYEGGTQQCGTVSVHVVSHGVPGQGESHQP